MSTLAEQLRLQQSLKPAQRELKGKGKASLLYDYHKAADVDAETLYNIALAGEQAALGMGRAHALHRHNDDVCMLHTAPIACPCASDRWVRASTVAADCQCLHPLAGCRSFLD